ncbi:hypothetical protein [Paenibacillus sp. GCM10023250]|uniref:hypothetical protein n=1 Tax=Paenibacillus sp. GCM10023250 TaxID=3252648 RepID=UPI003608C326
MNYALFLLGSLIEYCTTFVLMFALFRFPLRGILIQIVIIAFMMSHFSYITRHFTEINSYSSYLQLVLLIIVTWAVFRVPPFYSFIMNGAGFISLFAAQGITIFLIVMTGTPFSHITKDPEIIFATQLLSGIILVAVSRFVVIKNWGFDYVPASHRVYIEFNRTNSALFAVIASSIVIALVAGIALKGDLEKYIVVAGTTFLCSIPVFLYYSRRKDVEDAR